jgi:hypothetical protein
MSSFAIQECGYTGQVWLCSQHPHQFYCYSVSRNLQHEQLFDGVAGDVAEALSTLQAHIRYLASEGGSAARE